MLVRAVAMPCDVSVMSGEHATGRSGKEDGARWRCHPEHTGIYSDEGMLSCTRRNSVRGRLSSIVEGRGKVGHSPIILE